ncbi:hypothetical protein N0V88_007796 [Collariella sp. IMI 366227]|nr:hypothetical protein N0V88_007796 [Collariella sp. IMI 366227]
MSTLRRTLLLVLLATGALANPILHPRQLPWPDPVPASSIGPLDWSSIPPSLYFPPHSSSKLKVAASASLPATVDWRNRTNLNYITTPQDQGQCNSCWAFATTALIESMIRIEHGVWSKRSEADVHDMAGAACESVGNAEETLAWVAGMGADWVTDPSKLPPGVADWPCDPYKATVHGYEHCWDRRGRATFIPFYRAMGEVEDQKRYGDANIDAWTKYGLSNVNPDPWTRKRHQSGSMLQSGNGETHRNFELLISERSTGFSHVSRDGDSSKWSKVADIQGSILGQPAILGTSFNRDLHVVGVDKDKTLRQWEYSQTGKKWSEISTIQGKDIDGFPGVTQGDGSGLVMVVKHSDGTLNEYQQTPNSTTWTLTNSPIASSIAQSGPSLVQSNINLDIYNLQSASRGNLYTVAVRSDGKLQLFWRPGQDKATWSTGEVFGEEIPLNTPLVMIQDYFNTVDETSVGGFQLLVAVNGNVQHWERINDDIGTKAPVEGNQGKWKLKETVGAGVKHVWALVQGSFRQKMHMITEGTDGSMSYWEWNGNWAVVEKLPALNDRGWANSEPVTGG